MTPQIIDISADNGIVNWTEVAAAGVTNVILRACLGYGEVDKCLAKNAAGASAAGLIVSFYHLAYTHPTIEARADAKRQSQYFCDTIAATKITPKYIALDLETATTLSKEDYLTWVQTFLSNVQSITGITPMVYSYKSWLDTHLPSNHTLGSQYPLWIANYENINTPPCPVGWKSYLLWQYNESGVVAGCGTKVDCSMFNQSNI